MATKLTKYDKELGACPVCGKKKWWLNGVPLAGYCWGTEKKPHREVKRVVRGKLQPYRRVVILTREEARSREGGWGMEVKENLRGGRARK